MGSNRPDTAYTPIMTISEKSPNSDTGPLQPGSEISAGDKDVLFPSAYSSFAISVDAKDAAYASGTSSAHASSSAPSSRRGSAALNGLTPSMSGYKRPSALKSYKSDPGDGMNVRYHPGAHIIYSQPPPSYGTTATLSTIPASPLLGEDNIDDGANAPPRSVRWGTDSQHVYTPYCGYAGSHDHDHRDYEGKERGHRRRSTLAIIEYVHKLVASANNPVNSKGHPPSSAITPKRAVLLFLIVFSATYLAVSILPFGATRELGPELIKRGAGYYGNSHIFKGGDGLGDPHAEGDEHVAYSHGDVDERPQRYSRYMTYEDDHPDDGFEGFVARARRGGAGSKRKGTLAGADGEMEYERPQFARPKKLKSTTLNDEAKLADFHASLQKPLQQSDEQVVPSPPKRPLQLERIRQRVAKYQGSGRAAEDIDTPAIDSDGAKETAKNTLEGDVSPSAMRLNDHNSASSMSGSTASFEEEVEDELSLRREEELMRELEQVREARRRHRVELEADQNAGNRGQLLRDLAEASMLAKI